MMETAAKAEAKPIAQLENVRLIYHEPHAETAAVEGMTISVPKGEFVAIVGPSGCGKTSILSMLAGIVRPSEGSVEVLGRAPDAKANRIGYMLQRDQLLDWRTIEGNVLLGLEVKHLLTPETRAYAVELLERYGLGAFRTHYPHQLSGGMRQKAALIRTLAFSPELLLLDEPFSALDFQTRLLLADEVHSIIKRGGYTAVLVTHDISEAISMSDRVVILSGRPASIRLEVPIRLSGETPLNRRNDPNFKDYFDIVWKEMAKNEQYS